MVNYSLDVNTRLPVYFLLAGISIVISVFISYVQKFVPLQLITPSALMLYGIMLWSFNNFAWKSRSVSWLIRIPDLNGIWTGTVTRETGEDINITLTITQSWTRIDLVTESEETISSTRSVKMSIENANCISILFIYKVTGRTGLESGNTGGEGVTELRLINDSGVRKLVGPYYSNKLRKGSVQATISKKNELCE